MSTNKHGSSLALLKWVRDIMVNRTSDGLRLCIDH